MGESAGTVVLENKTRRLEAVERYAILDTPPERAFDRITRLAAQIMDAPVAFISVVGRDRIWLKSVFGLEGVRDLPLEPGLCGTAIERDQPYVIEDAARDWACARNTLILEPFGMRFYVGIPLVTNDGFIVGTLCALDRKPRHVESSKVEMLGDLAKIVIDELELRVAARRLADEALRREHAEAKEALASRTSLTDDLTGLANRRALERELDRRDDALKRGATSDGAVAVLDIDGLKAVNDLRGHDAGDVLLRLFGGSLADTFVEQALFRYGGDEFVILFDLARDATGSSAGVSFAIRAVRERGFPEIGASFGIATVAEASGSPREALRLADSRMYAMKISRR